MRDGHGLEGQEARCRRFAEERGYEIAAVFRDEGVSGGVIDREGMQHVLDLLDTKRDSGEWVVIIDDIKRLARDLIGHFTLRKAIQTRGARLESPSHKFGNEPEEVFVESIMAATAELERNQNKKQVLNRMKARLEAGYWTFYPPPGYAYPKVPGHGKLLVPHEPEAGVIREAMEGFASGGSRTRSTSSISCGRNASTTEADGTPMTVKQALQLINKFLTKGDFDADTQFCLHWFEQYGWEVGPFGTADVLARSKGTSVEGVRQAGVIASGGGSVRLLRWKEYPTDWDPTKDTRLSVWEALHYLGKHGRGGCGRAAVRGGGGEGGVGAAVGVPLVYAVRAEGLGGHRDGRGDRATPAQAEGHAGPAASEGGVMLTRLSLKNFTVFGDAVFPFAAGLNVIVGENGAGKSHVLKAAYTVAAVSAWGAKDSGSETPTKSYLETTIAKKLRGVFRPDAVGRLARRQAGRSRCEVEVRFKVKSLRLGFSFNMSSKTEVSVDVCPAQWEGEPPVFLPTRELLTIYPGFVSLYEVSALKFEETWKDTCVLLGAPLARGKRLAEINQLLQPLEEQLGGKVVLDGDDFYLKPSRATSKPTWWRKGTASWP